MTSRLIGLTGSIGAGKSTVARGLIARGAELVDADVLAREATADPAVLSAIRARFGEDVVTGGVLDRGALGRRVFADPEAREALNAIVHPWVRRASAERVAELRARRPPPPVILLDIPLLYENGLERTVDAVVVVDAPLEQRVARVMRRSGLPAAEVRARDAAQMPAAEKRARADFVVLNDAGLDELDGRLGELWEALVGLHTGSRPQGSDREPYA